MSDHTCGKCEHVAYCGLALHIDECGKINYKSDEMEECPARTSERQKDEEIKMYRDGLEEIANKCGYITVDELQELARHHLKTIPKILKLRRRESD